MGGSDVCVKTSQPRRIARVTRRRYMRRKLTFLGAAATFLAAGFALVVDDAVFLVVVA